MCCSCVLSKQIFLSIFLLYTSGIAEKYHRGWVNLFYFIHALFGLLTPFGNFMFRGRKSQSRWKLHKMRVKIPPKKRDFDVVAVGDFFSCFSVFFLHPLYFKRRGSMVLNSPLTNIFWEANVFSRAAFESISVRREILSNTEVELLMWIPGISEDYSVCLGWVLIILGITENDANVEFQMRVFRSWLERRPLNLCAQKFWQNIQVFLFFWLFGKPCR